jgi:hypothetical protein
MPSRRVEHSARCRGRVPSLCLPTAPQERRERRSRPEGRRAGCPESKKSPRERAPLSSAPSAHPALRVRGRQRNFSTARPCADEKRCASCASPCGFIHRRPPLHKGPLQSGASMRQELERSFALAGASVLARRMRAPFEGPHALRRRAAEIARRVADRKSAIVSSAQGCAVETTRRPERTLRTRMCAGRNALGRPSFWLLFVGRATKSDSPVAAGEKL